MDALWVKGGALEVCDGALFHAPAPENCVCGDADCCQTTVSLPDLTTVDPDDVITGLDPLFVVGEEERASNLEAEAGSVVIAGSFTHDWFFFDTGGQPVSGTTTTDMSGTWPDDYEQPFTSGEVQAYAGNAGCGVTAFVNTERPHGGGGGGQGIDLTIQAQIEWDASLEKWFLRVAAVVAVGNPTPQFTTTSISARYDMLTRVWEPATVSGGPTIPGMGTLSLSVTHLTNFVRFTLDGPITNSQAPDNSILDVVANNVRINIHKDWLDFCSGPQSWSVTV